MKRLIKYHSHYNEIKFSDCSTKYEILPYLVDDNAGSKELREFADALGYGRVDNCKALKKNNSYHNSDANIITHYVTIDETIDGCGMYSDEKYQVRLAFITLRVHHWEGANVLTPIETPKTEMTLEQAYEIVGNQSYGVESIYQMNQDCNDESHLIMAGWHYYHEINLLGYDLDQFEKLIKVDDRNFYDSVFDCGDCGKGDYVDSGYTYNYQIVECTQLGINCGCYNKYLTKNWKNFINDFDSGLQGDIVEELVKQGKIVEVDDFCARWGDGVHPEDILKNVLKDDSKAQFIFGIDGVGQFRTDFTLYKVIPHLKMVG